MPVVYSALAVVAAYLLGSLSFAVLVSRAMGLSDPRTFGSKNPALVGLAAFAGHLWPVFFGFKGGKGVATALGVLVGVSGWLGLATLGAWLVVVFLSRYVSLASMAAALFAPAFYLLASGPLWYADHRVAAAMGAMAALLVWRHQENIGRLVRGTESKLGQSKAKAGVEPRAQTPPAHPKKKHRHGK